MGFLITKVKMFGYLQNLRNHCLFCMCKKQLSYVNFGNGKCKKGYEAESRLTGQGGRVSLRIPPEIIKNKNLNLNPKKLQFLKKSI